MANTLLRIHVTPRSSRNQIIGWRDGVLCIKLTAPPVEGAANEALVKFIAGSIGIRKSQVTLVSGDKSREKAVEVAGLSEDEIRNKLS